MWPFHRHRWHIISASCDGEYRYCPATCGFSLMTHAVGKCECGKIRRFMFPGKHSLENLQGEQAAVDAVLRTLER